MQRVSVPLPPPSGQMVRPTGATQSASGVAAFVVLIGTPTADTLSNPPCSLQLVFANSRHSSRGGHLDILSFGVFHHQEEPGQPESAVQYGRSVINAG